MLPSIALLLALAPNLLAQTASAAQETPRALLERAAFAEEHERDFAGAERLYAEAEAAARKVQDAAAAQEASAALARLRVRQGKAGAGQAESDDQLSLELVQAAMDQLQAAERVPFGGDPSNYRQIAASIADFGPTVVPLLRFALLPEATPPHFVEKRVRFGNQPQLAAALSLAAMQSEAADAALNEAFGSLSPIVRKCVVQAARVERHLDVLLRAQADPVANIRLESFQKLLQSGAERIAPTMLAEARKGSREAAEWLGRFQPRAALELVADRQVDLAQRGSAAQYFQKSPLSASLVLAAVEVALSEPPLDEGLARSIWNYLGKLEPGPLADALRPQLESAILARLGATTDVEALSTLARVHSPKTLEAMTRWVRARQGRLDEDEAGTLAGCAFTTNRVNSGPDAFEPWIELFSAISATTSEPEAERGEAALDRLFKEILAIAMGPQASASEEAIATAWSRLADDHRPAYLAALARRWMEGMQGKEDLLLPATSKTLARALLHSDEVNEVLVGLRATASNRWSDLTDDVLAVDVRQRSQAVKTLAALRAVDPQRVLDAVRQAFVRGVAAATVEAQVSEVFFLLTTLDPSDRLDVWRAALAEAKTPDVRAGLYGGFVRGSFNGVKDVAFLVEVYPKLEAEYPLLRVPALQRFGQHLTEGALPILERELRNPDTAVREAAMEAAKAFRENREAIESFESWRQSSSAESETIQRLAQLLQSSNRDVVLGAVQALGILRARTAMPSLVALLERQDPELRNAVQVALHAMDAP